MKREAEDAVNETERGERKATKQQVLESPKNNTSTNISKADDGRNSPKSQVESVEKVEKDDSSNSVEQQLASLENVKKTWVDRYRDYSFEKHDIPSRETAATSSLAVSTINRSIVQQSSLDSVVRTNEKTAGMKKPSNLVMGKDGTTFIVETFNHVIRKIAPRTGVTSIFVGEVGQPGAQDGKGTTARLFLPTCICMDSKENIFVTDSGNEVIRMVTKDGEVTTIAGSFGKAGHVDGHDNVHFNCPIGIICDEYDRLYVADAGNHCIRIVSFDDHSTDSDPDVALSSSGNETPEDIPDETPGGTREGEIKQKTSEEKNDEISEKMTEVTHSSSSSSPPPPPPESKRTGRAEVTTMLFQNEDVPQWPSALMVDSTSNVFIFDKSSGHMSRITADGKVVGDFEDYEDGLYTDSSISEEVGRDITKVTSGNFLENHDASGFVIDQMGMLSGGRDDPGRAYMIEKVDKSQAIATALKQGGVDLKDLDSLRGRPSGASPGKQKPVQAYVMMSVDLDSEGNPIIKPRPSEPTEMPSSFV